MTFEVTLANLIAVIAMVCASLWAMGKQLIEKQEQRATEREERFVERVEALTQSVVELAHTNSSLRERVARIERNDESVLGHDDLASIYERVNKVAEEVAQLRGSFVAARSTLDSIQKFLLTQKGHQ